MSNLRQVLTCQIHPISEVFVFVHRWRENRCTLGVEGTLFID